MKEKEKKNKRKLSIGVRLLAVLGLAVLLIGCKNNARTPDKWVVEIQITEKTTTTRESSKNGTETVYLINCEDAEGSQHVFELTDTALEGKFEAEEAFRELKTGKAYKFRVGWHDPKTENQPGYHPSIYGAVKMEGLNLDNLPDISGEEKKTQEKIKIIVPSKETNGETTDNAKEETTEAAESAKAIEESIEVTEESAESAEENIEIADEHAEEEEESTVQQESAETASEKLQVPPEGEEQTGAEPENVDEVLVRDIEERVAQSLQESFEAEKKELEDAVRSLEERIGNIEREGQQAGNGA